MTPRLTIVWHPEAVADARAARIWYGERNQRAAEVFVEELGSAEALIGEAPQRWPEVVPGFRRFLLHRYPFAVVYRFTAERVEIVAVAHGRRKPGYWRRRVESGSAT